MASHQRYTNPTARDRMAQGLCPECGGEPDSHGGWGAWNCSLTDNGVAGRIYQYQKDLKDTEGH